MNIKASIALYKGITAAGFRLSKDQSMETRNGICWSTILVLGKTQIFEASNEGRGGADQIRVLLAGDTLDQRVVAMRPFVDKLYAVPEVATFIRTRVTEHLEFSRQCKSPNDIGRDFAAEIEAAKVGPLPRDEETIASVAGAIADAKKTVSVLKRAARGKICWLEKQTTPGAQDDGYISVKAEDNPANRAAVMKMHGEKIDVFINDLIAGL
ncbi:hypothetical protein LA345_40820 (plasmid) [Burkholderia vietnamiensis]|nr:hypothetical protein [Burkholderia vietnamiensis]